MYKIKRFSYPNKIGYREKYKSTSSRLKSAGRSGLIGAGVGAALGGIISPRGAGKYGASIGAAIGGAIGGGSSWSNSSKSAVDKRNKEYEANDKKLLAIINNPDKHLKEHLGQLYDYSKVEDKIGRKMPSELYKLIKVNKQFMPIAAKLMKEYQHVWYPEYELDNPQYILNDLNYMGIGESMQSGIVLLSNPQMADDTFMVWYPESDTYDFELWQNKGSYKSLKSILVQALKWELEYYDDYHEIKYGEENPQLAITREYLDFIQSKM